MKLTCSLIAVTTINWKKNKFRQVSSPSHCSNSWFIIPKSKLVSWYCIYVATSFGYNIFWLQRLLVAKYFRHSMWARLINSVGLQLSSGHEQNLEISYVWFSINKSLSLFCKIIKWNMITSAWMCISSRLSSCMRILKLNNLWEVVLKYSTISWTFYAFCSKTLRKILWNVVSKLLTN